MEPKDDNTKIFLKLVRLFLAERNEIIDGLVYEYLDQLKESLSKSDKFPNMNSVKNELNMYL